MAKKLLNSLKLKKLAPFKLGATADMGLSKPKLKNPKGKISNSTFMKYKR